MSGVLFIVATPIGNLDDITLRAVDTLRQVDLVAAEDTRHSRRLLTHLGLNKQMFSLHEHNERQRIKQVLAHLAEGRSIALVSDAGTPLISDPGYPLVDAVIAAGFRVVPIPGASSVVTALSAAGLPTDRFTFHGFLSAKNSERDRQLQGLVGLPGTQVMFESTHRIERLLQSIERILPMARLVVAKELTKRHETFIRGDASTCLQALQADPALSKGEFVVLLNLALEAQAGSSATLDADSLLQRLMQDLPLKKAVRLAADLSGERKNDLYQRALALNAKDEA